MEHFFRRLKTQNMLKKSFIGKPLILWIKKVEHYKYALEISDNKAASERQKARKKLFSLIFKHPKTG